MQVSRRCSHSQQSASSSRLCSRNSVLVSALHPLSFLGLLGDCLAPVVKTSLACSLPLSFRTLNYGFSGSEVAYSAIAVRCQPPFGSVASTACDTQCTQQRIHRKHSTSLSLRNELTYSRSGLKASHAILVPMKAKARRALSLPLSQTRLRSGRLHVDRRGP